MRLAVVPWILRELEREPDQWFRALHALTSANHDKLTLLKT
jgi:hypothetical protein